MLVDRWGNYPGRRTGACITRWYQRGRALPHELPVGQVRSVAVWAGTTVEVPLTMVRPYTRNGSQGAQTGLHARSNRRSGQRARRRRAAQAAVWAGVVAGGCLMRPMPRGIGEITYTMAPMTMIESTLITQSRIVIAVASGSGTP
jgi:hypothetical protein